MRAGAPRAPPRPRARRTRPRVDTAPPSGARTHTGTCSGGRALAHPGGRRARPRRRPPPQRGRRCSRPARRRSGCTRAARAPRGASRPALPGNGLNLAAQPHGQAMLPALQLFRCAHIRCILGYPGSAPGLWPSPPFAPPAAPHTAGVSEGLLDARCRPRFAARTSRRLGTATRFDGSPLEPALPAEERDGAQEEQCHDGDHGRETGRAEPEVHAEDPGDQRQRQEDDAEHREELEPVVLPVRDHRLVRCLERLHDLLEVVEEVPDPLRGVDDVVEVDLEVLREETLRVALQHAQRRALGLDDLAVGDDLLLGVRDVADDLLGTPLEHVVLDRVQLRPDLVEDRKAVVEEVVEDVVEEIAGALREEIRPQVRIVFAAPEEVRDRQELGVRQRDEEVRAEEDVELGRVQALDALVVEGEVEDDEEIVRVLVDLRSLALGEDVFDVELVEAEATGEDFRLEDAGAVDVHPGEPVSGELGDPRLDALGDVPRRAGGSSAPNAGQRGPGHWYSEGRRPASPEYVILPSNPRREPFRPFYDAGRGQSRLNGREAARRRAYAPRTRPSPRRALRGARPGSPGRRRRRATSGRLRGAHPERRGEAPSLPRRAWARRTCPWRWGRRRARAALASR